MTKTIKKVANEITALRCVAIVQIDARIRTSVEATFFRRSTRTPDHISSRPRTEMPASTMYARMPM